MVTTESATTESATTESAMTVRMFLKGTTMSGGATHHYLQGATPIATIATAAKYRLYSIYDAVPALWRVGGGGVAVQGELYDLSYEVMRDSLMPIEPPELELGLVELEDGSGALAMFLRRHLLATLGLRDISSFGSWRRYTEHLDRQRE